MVVSGPAVQGCRSDSTAAVHFDGFKSVDAAAVAAVAAAARAPLTDRRAVKREQDVTQPAAAAAKGSEGMATDRLGSLVRTCARSSYVLLSVAPLSCACSLLCLAIDSCHPQDGGPSPSKRRSVLGLRPGGEDQRPPQPALGVVPKAEFPKVAPKPTVAPANRRAVKREQGVAQPAAAAVAPANRRAVKREQGVAQPAAAAEKGSEGVEVRGAVPACLCVCVVWSLLRAVAAGAGRGGVGGGGAGRDQRGGGVERRHHRCHQRAVRAGGPGGVPEGRGAGQVAVRRQGRPLVCGLHRGQGRPEDGVEGLGPLGCSGGRDAAAVRGGPVEGGPRRHQVGRADGGGRVCHSRR